MPEPEPPPAPRPTGPLASTLSAEERIGDGERIEQDAQGDDDELTDGEGLERIDFARMTKTGATGATINLVHGMTPDEYIESIKTEVNQVRVLFDVPLGDGPADTLYMDPTSVNEYQDPIVDPFANLAGDSTPIVLEWLPEGNSNLVRTSIPLEVMSEAQQIDIGANICLTNRRDILQHCQQIRPFTIGSAEQGRRMVSTTLGYIPLATTGDETIWAPTYYCPEASGTLISPDFICSKSDSFNRFGTDHNIDTNKGVLLFHPRDDGTPLEVPLTRRNRLWYIDYEILTTSEGESVMAKAVRKRSTTPSAQLASELWALRMGCPGMTTLQKTAKTTSGIDGDIVPHPFRYSDIASDAKTRRTPATTDTFHPASRPAERFHMDFGFMRASSDEYRKVKGKPRIVESFDGYTSYIIVMDAVSRKMWIFLSKSKEPPVELVDAFLGDVGLKEGPLRAVRTDQGGELARSAAFRSVVAKHGYTVEPTGSDAPNQNGLAERPNQTLGNMVRSLLYMSGLHPKFWSAALLHAAWLYDRLYHTGIGKTPLEAWTGQKPEMSRIRLFGSRVAAREPGKRAAKLDRHVFHGIFLGYTGTDKNIKYWDSDSGRLKTAKHAIFDEAHYSQPHRPPGPQLLYDLGLEEESTTPTSTGPVQVELAPAPPLHKDAPKLSTAAILHPLPLRESATPIPTTAAAAAVEVTDDVDEFTPVTMCSEPFGTSFQETLAIHGIHQTAGIIVEEDRQRGHPRLLRFQPGTAIAKTVRWRSRLKGAHILRIGDRDISRTEDIVLAVAHYRSLKKRSVPITFAFDEIRNTISSQGVPQLYFDQMTAIRDHLRAIKERRDVELTTTVDGVVHRVDTGKQKLTYRILRQREDFEDWRQSTFKQLDQYERQHMFGTPVRAPTKAEIFPWVWTFVEKTDGTKKARGVCDGNPKRATVANDRYTYASCVDKTGERIFYAGCAIKGYSIYHCDASNAFAEADAPSQRFYMRVDAIFRDWWVNHKGRTPIPDGHVLPVQKAMQGHPESPRLWERKINGILTDMGFIATAHEPCLYHGTVGGKPAMVLRMVDDFAIGCADETTANLVMDGIDKQLEEELKRYGQLQHFLGIDIEQTREYIKISGETYLKKVLHRHNMMESSNFGLNPAKAVPMHADHKYVQSLDTAKPPSSDKEATQLEKEMGFRYRQVIGELIFALITCRPDISFAVTKLSKFAANPAKEHYIAAKNVLKYLRATVDRGIYYWRPQPRQDLPLRPRPTPDTSMSDRVASGINMPADRLHSYMDSDWASDVSHRRSVTGIGYLLAGALIYWKSRYQPTIAMSSTEAEFYAASDSGKVALYIRSILGDIDIEQHQATTMFEDNNGALMMANAGQPTKRTRHIDIRHFALLDWVEQDLVFLERIDTDRNHADALTKALARILFHRHFDVLMGREVPSYVE